MKLTDLKKGILPKVFALGTALSSIATPNAQADTYHDSLMDKDYLTLEETKSLSAHLGGCIVRFGEPKDEKTDAQEQEILRLVNGAFRNGGYDVVYARKTSNEPNQFSTDMTCKGETLQHTFSGRAIRNLRAQIKRNVDKRPVQLASNTSSAPTL